VFSWRSRYLSWQWDGYQLLSACCQAHVGTSGCVLPCPVLNDHAVQGRRLSGHFPEIGDSWAWLLGARVCAMLGHKNELELGR
jgi:hypothetical protein